VLKALVALDCMTFNAGATGKVHVDVEEC
jgi:hypothetical protein